ncbi:MAG: glycosyltransferase [Micromonosporaceae bacterium]|nr:glycosyltransferase [Micromonosporaceae bacterium]
MATPEPMVSVVISARGNGDRLSELLRALETQSLPAAEFEVVVVDNDPPGPHRPVAETSAQTPWPYQIQVIAEPKPGLSLGRNRGVQAARGRYVAITDPDIVPTPGWLAALVAAAEQEHAFCVGGRTVVDYPEGTAVPLTESLRECHGAVHWPEGRVPAAWPYWITGCNLLFDRKALLELGLFRTDLGRKGRWLGDCEDLELINRARQSGWPILIEPAAVVTHRVYRRETTLGYLVHQGAGHGVCLARMHLSVRVEPAAIRADRHAIADALGGFILSYGFLDRGRGVQSLRDLVRIGAYHTERLRLRLLRRRANTPQPLTYPREHP